MRDRPPWIRTFTLPKKSELLAPNIGGKERKYMKALCVNVSETQRVWNIQILLDTKCDPYLILKWVAFYRVLIASKIALPLKNAMS
ncbi:MAG: hypothetical protein J7K15_11360 [Deltaproteobacteria bacterium]|nr:hypothetical protein [Deltaproteobacteria bacterium]